MNKKIVIFLWVLLFVLSLFLLLVVPEYYTPQIGMAIIFNILAFLSPVSVIIIKGNNQFQTFYKYPQMIASIFYIVLQFVISLYAVLNSGVIALKTYIIINVVFMAIMWSVILLLVIGRNNIEKLDARQKNHHTIL